MELTAEQLKAINEIEDNLQIVACAGSGKTEVIVQRIANILEKRTEVCMKNIVAFTFTEKAADSLENRIRLALSANNKILTNDMYIGTIHGFCHKLLKEYSDFFKEFKILNTVKNHLFVARYYDECGMSDLNLNPYPMDNIKVFLECIDKMVDDFSNYNCWEEIHKNVFDKYRSCLYKHKYIDFALLILETIRQIENNVSVQNYLSTIKYLIVDEYQDIDDLQEKLISLFAKKGTNVCVVGDDDQTIYQFRGSNANNMICFPHRYSNVCQIRLEKNFRCATSIVDVADQVIQFNENRIQKKMISGAADFSVSNVSARRFRSQYDEYEAISDQIVKIHTENIPYSEIAILVRKRKYINPICLSLKANGIPYVSDSAEQFFKGTYFKCFVNTFQNVVDINKSQLYECWQGYVDEKHFNMGFRYLRQEARNGGNGYTLPLSKLFKEFLNKMDFLNMNAADIKARQESMEGFTTILDDYDEIYHDWQFSARVTGLLKFLDTQAEEEYKYHNFVSGTVPTDSVQVMTIHKSKGLEFSTIFLPDLEEQVFPSSDGRGRKYWHVLGGTFKENKDKYDSNIDDERKLFYVAVTRAKQNLFLYYELSTKNLSTFVKEAACSRYLDIEKEDLNYKVPRKNEIKDDFFTMTHIGDKQMQKMETYEQQREYQEQIRMIRHKVMDYYGSAIHFFPAARADLARVSKLNEDELVAEARKLGII